MREQATIVHVPQGRELFVLFLGNGYLAVPDKRKSFRAVQSFFIFNMTHIYKLLLAMLLCIVPASQMYSSVLIDGLYYNIYETSKTATVTYKSSTSNNSTYVSGDLVIPSVVEYNDISYQVTSIGNYAFEGCSGLTSVTIPASVTSIGECAFSGCSGLTSITIQSGVTSIGSCAFSNCSGLTSITIPASVTSIGECAFSSCSGLTSITIPASVTSIGGGVFYGCIGLESIMVASGNAVYDSRDNCNAIIHTESNSLISGCQNTIIPESVTSIGKSAFYKCMGLTSITIPESVTSIGSQAFFRCYGLTSITIPASVTSIGGYAFRDCSGLTSVTTYITNTFILLDDQFSGINSDATLYVPTGTTSLYETARWTQFFAHIDEFVATDVTVETAKEATETERYDMQGRRISNPAKGINILRMSDGTTRKVMVK